LPASRRNQKRTTKVGRLRYATRLSIFPHQTRFKRDSNIFSNESATPARVIICQKRPVYDCAEQHLTDFYRFVLKLTITSLPPASVRWVNAQHFLQVSYARLLRRCFFGHVALLRSNREGLSIKKLANNGCALTQATLRSGREVIVSLAQSGKIG